ncbi:MAG: FHA domain-containing protein [Anaerolineae bacterium]
MSNSIVQRNRCPNCGHNNPTHETFCEQCGQIIDVANSTLARRVRGEAASGEQKRSVMIVLQNDKDTIKVTLQPDQRATVGRLVPYMLLVPDVDLAPFNAADLGVSRNHAVLDNTAKGVQITDLGSRNGTYINGKRLDSLNSLILKDGDKLRFGQLEIELHLKASEQVRTAVPVVVAAAIASTPAHGTPAVRSKETRLLSP